MSQFARITSLDALREFKAAIADFAEQASLSLSEAQSDAQRTIWWIQNDRYAHWQREKKKRTDKLAQAKADLFRAQLASSDTRTSAVVERKNLAKAQHLLDESEEKLRCIKKWQHMLEREFMLFKAGCGQVASAVAGDLPSAITRMDKMISSLEAYVALAAPTSGIVPSSPSVADALAENSGGQAGHAADPNAPQSSQSASTTDQESQP